MRPQCVPYTDGVRWSAIQTLLERSKSDVLILLDCCAGAASATFPNGNSITETISASSWEAIAPDPGRYSFTNALIEVLQEWRMRNFSAAMLHAEVLARLKHPRPITINGKHFEARSTPVHFMMTANHKAPSIELSRMRHVEEVREPEPHRSPPIMMGRATDTGEPSVGMPASKEPDEDTPHVMISLALEDDQRLDINAWEQWLNAFPSMAKYVKVQGVFKSHSTLLLVSLPVMVWDLLPEDPAISFVAFIRSNNLAIQRKPQPQQVSSPAAVRGMQAERLGPDTASFMTGVSGTTIATGMTRAEAEFGVARPFQPATSRPGSTAAASAASSRSASSQYREAAPTAGSSSFGPRHVAVNQQQLSRRTTFGDNVPDAPKFSSHVERRLEEYYHREPDPSDAQSAFLASNLGIEQWHLEVWFHHRRQRDSISNKLAAMEVKDVAHPTAQGPLMILPADLNRLLELSLPGHVLMFDMRTSKDFGRSHILDAIHFRVPQSYLNPAPLDLIEAVLPDGAKKAPEWIRAKCMVFYSRSFESSFECPAAEIMAAKLRKEGWLGRAFILRGHYREFSHTFNNYVVDAHGQQSAHSMLATDADRETADQEYAAWLAHVETEDRARPQLHSPGTQSPERFEALEANEKELEAEFKTLHGHLFKKVTEVEGNTADMVEYLDRGLAKMRDTQTPPVYAPGHAKVYERQAANEETEYVDVSQEGTVRSHEQGDGAGGILGKMFRR